MAFYVDVYSSQRCLSMSVLILLIYFLISSSSSASLFHSSDVHMNEMNEKKDLSDEVNQYPSSLFIDYFNGNNNNQISSQERLLNLLLTSARIQEDNNNHYQPYEIHFENRRNVPQSFHAMRG